MSVEKNVELEEVEKVTVSFVIAKRFARAIKYNYGYPMQDGQPSEVQHDQLGNLAQVLEWFYKDYSVNKYESFREDKHAHHPVASSKFQRVVQWGDPDARPVRD
jgi:hypothetical protein